MREVVRVAAPLRAETVRVLRAALTSGDYGPGDRLNEKEMLARLRVSRTTLRESLRQLEAERLIVLIPGQGPIVATLDSAEASQIYQVRAALESLMVRLFASRLLIPEIDRLKECLAALKAANEGADIDAFLDAKDDFYAVLLQGAANNVLSEQLEALSARITRLRHLSLARPGRAVESIEELERLVAAIERRDTDAAVRSCEEHVRNAGRAALESLILAGGQHQPVGSAGNHTRRGRRSMAGSGDRERE